MASLFEDVTVVVILADYIAVDASNKMNILGGGFNITQLRATGTTSPMYVAAIVDVPAKHIGVDFSLSLDLRSDDTGTVVQVPGQSGSEALRIQQLLKAERPNLPNVYLPTTMFGRCQALVGFAGGIPLDAGQTYRWHVQVDGQHRKTWIARFHVAGPPPPPIFGGPTGSHPSEILPLEHDDPFDD